jgi:hypothetical protein
MSKKTLLIFILVVSLAVGLSARFLEQENQSATPVSAVPTTPPERDLPAVARQNAAPQEPLTPPLHRAGPAEIYPSEAVPGAFNPAVTQETIHDTICSAGWTARIRPPTSYTNRIKGELLASLHLPGTRSDYELDHFIPLEIGGAPRDRRNLWMEPYGDLAHPMTTSESAAARRTGEDLLPNSPAKDTVETHLKAEVCAGRMTLVAAQQAVQTDWYAYYSQWRGRQARRDSMAPVFKQPRTADRRNSPVPGG